MAKYQILHTYPERPTQGTATLLVSFKSLSNADSDAVERFEKFCLNQNQDWQEPWFLWVFSQLNAWFS